MNIIINGIVSSSGEIAQHELDVSTSFILGYESVGGLWTGSILIQTSSLSSSLAYAKNNNYEMVIRSTSGMESYISVASSSYPDVLTVMPAGHNDYILIYTGNIPQNILITGAGDVNNETGYNIEFFAPDPIGIEPDLSSFSNGYIAGQIAYIMDEVPCGHWEARYRAQQTAIPGTSGSSFDGYGLIDINSAMAYTGSIADDPFITDSESGSGDIPLGGFQMRYLTPITISSSLDVNGAIRVGKQSPIDSSNRHNITGSIRISSRDIQIKYDSSEPNAFIIDNGNYSTSAYPQIMLKAYPSQSNIFYILNSIEDDSVSVAGWSNKGILAKTTGSIAIGNRSTHELPFEVDINNLSVLVTGSFNVSGTSNFDGTISASNLLVTNNITTDTFTVNTFVSSATDVVSGSTKFGSLQTHTHQFTGSLYVTGSTHITGNLSLTTDITARNINLRATNMIGSPNIYLKSYADYEYWGNGIKIYRARGTQNSASILLTEDVLGDFAFFLPAIASPNVGVMSAKISSYYTESVGLQGSDLRFFTTDDSEGINVVERMRIAANGNVGIGVISAPNELLYVAGDTKFGSNSTHTHQFIGSLTGSFNQGQSNIASGIDAHAGGQFTTASGDFAHSEGYQTIASGLYAHAEGNFTLASGLYAHAEGLGTIARGLYAHAEGSFTSASGYYSHAEGLYTIASGDVSKAEGIETLASGQSSHAEGRNTFATNENSHAEGLYTTASGRISHAEGIGNSAKSYAEHAGGTYNTSYTPSSTSSINEDDRLFVIGNGTSDSVRKDTLRIMKSGVKYLTGSLYQSGSIEITGGTLIGTSSYAVSASYAQNAGGISSLWTSSLDVNISRNSDVAITGSLDISGSIILTSPNGIRFSLTVDDSGSLTTTEI